MLLIPCWFKPCARCEGLIICHHLFISLQCIKVIKRMAFILFLPSFVSNTCWQSLCELKFNQSKAFFLSVYYYRYQIATQSCSHKIRNLDFIDATFGAFYLQSSNSHDWCSCCPITRKVEISWPITSLSGRDFMYVSYVSWSSHGLTCLLSSKMEFLLGNPFSTPVGHCIGMYTDVREIALRLESYTCKILSI